MSGRVYFMSCEELAEYLNQNSFSSEVCKVIKDNKVDGDTFMELSEGDFKEMLPGKIGVVKKLIRVQRKYGGADFRKWKKELEKARFHQNDNPVFTKCADSKDFVNPAYGK